MLKQGGLNKILYITSLVKGSVNISNKSLEILTELYLSDFYFKIFHSFLVSSLFLPLLIFLKLIIESKFTCFTQIANITNWGVTGLVFQGIISTVID